MRKYLNKGTKEENYMDGNILYVGKGNEIEKLFIEFAENDEDVFYPWAESPKFNKRKRYGIELIPTDGAYLYEMSIISENVLKQYGIKF